VRLFFDIQHRGDFFLDDEGEEFRSIGAACDHLAQVLCAFMHSGGDVAEIRDMVVDITDRGKIHLVVPIIDILPEPLPRAA
jgi:hypothetical protein